MLLLFKKKTRSNILLIINFLWTAGLDVLFQTFVEATNLEPIFSSMQFNGRDELLHDIRR